MELEAIPKINQSIDIWFDKPVLCLLKDTTKADLNFETGTQVASLFGIPTTDGYNAAGSTLGRKS